MSALAVLCGACAIAGVRGTEVLRYCQLKGSVLTFYETDKMARPRSSVIMSHVDSTSHPARLRGHTNSVLQWLVVRYLRL